ncbi:hypothetical protein EYF80_039472 [Liparis tanakae]|uniref:Uncharacterized protein n=1 Tax=Liparis tanakae TaxID=230148 RepID=A0A4Z2GCC0_9TELE|nr:hypothetical protein EYF80_039472 [Liparis tanakae]
MEGGGWRVEGGGWRVEGGGGWQCRGSYAAVEDLHSAQRLPCLLAMDTPSHKLTGLRGTQGAGRDDSKGVLIVFSGYMDEYSGLRDALHCFTGYSVILNTKHYACGCFALTPRPLHFPEHSCTPKTLTFWHRRFRHTFKEESIISLPLEDSEAEQQCNGPAFKKLLISLYLYDIRGAAESYLASHLANEPLESFPQFP